MPNDTQAPPHGAGHISRLNITEEQVGNLPPGG
jgi:hypothetical protein